MSLNKLQAEMALQNQLALPQLVEAANLRASQTGIPQIITLVSRLIVNHRSTVNDVEAKSVLFRYLVVTPGINPYLIDQDKADELLANQHAEIFSCQSFSTELSANGTQSEYAEV